MAKNNKNKVNTKPKSNKEEILKENVEENTEEVVKEDKVNEPKETVKKEETKDEQKNKVRKEKKQAENKEKANKQDKKSEKIIEEIEKEKKQRKKMSKEYEKKANKKIFRNVIIAIVILAFCILKILGYINIKEDIFIVDLKVFSISILIFAIILFERSYKNIDLELFTHGLESLFVAIATLCEVYIYQLFTDKFIMVIAIESLLISAYYIFKCTRIYSKTKKEYIKSLNDISEIVKEEKIIKIETHRRQNRKTAEKKDDKKSENKNEKIKEDKKSNKKKENSKKEKAEANESKKKENLKKEKSEDKKEEVKSNTNTKNKTDKKVKNKKSK